MTDAGGGAPRGASVRAPCRPESHPFTNSRSPICLKSSRQNENARLQVIFTATLGYPEAKPM